MQPDPATDALDERVQQEIKRYWGFESLRPIQAKAIRAGLARKDSLVVMPTGGGKSLCYQVPPLVTGKLSVVVSPLISLMKDQVDGLLAIGYPAQALHSGLSPGARREVEIGIAQNQYKLLFVAPERLMAPGFLQTLQRAGVDSFAIDEAHCISQWGHDFRPEYRQLAVLKQRFPDVSVHGFTATATPRVQQDIVNQLGLHEPEILIGKFDRPNLTYRVLPTQDLHRQIIEVVRRHKDEATIIYCLSRKDTEALAALLIANKIKAGYYHAGMEPIERQKAQEAFSNEELDVVVATVAFGMGIDRSNVRCVIHAAIPKSIEGYQQETGRAGRDGLEAECVLFYSPADIMRWESLIDKNTLDTPESQAQSQNQLDLLGQVRSFCNNAKCRHKFLSEYFGQAYTQPNCGACDVCLNEVEGVEGATVIAQKILSAVARTGQRFGVGHTVDVLVGANTEMVRKCGHAELSTYGILKDTPRPAVQAFVYQLIDQGLLSRTPGDRPTLALNDDSLQVMRGKHEVFLLRPRESMTTRTRTQDISWEGVDRGLFEALRELRKQIAHERQVPPFVIFGDATLREMARLRPGTTDAMRNVRGVGDKRLADLGEAFLQAITDYCVSNGLSLGVEEASSPASTSFVRTGKVSSAKDQAWQMFKMQASLTDVMQATGRAKSTVGEYLAEFIAANKPDDISSWVSEETYREVAMAASDLERPTLKPIYEKLEGRVPYEEIKITLIHMSVTA